MEVILKADVNKLGKVGKIVKVTPGYARNFLLPKGLAMLVTPANIRQLEREKERLEQKSAKLQQEAEALKERLSAVSLTMAVLAKEDKEEAEGQEDKEDQGGELYGSVTAHDIVIALKEDGFQIEKDAILLSEPLRKLGIYEVPVRLHPEVTAKVKVWVVKK